MCLGKIPQYHAGSDTTGLEICVTALLVRHKMPLRYQDKLQPQLNIHVWSAKRTLPADFMWQGVGNRLDK